MNTIWHYFSILIYVVLRLVRKNFISAKKLYQLRGRFGWLPYRFFADAGVYELPMLVRNYHKFFKRFNVNAHGKNILIFGAGPTNLLAYALLKVYPQAHFICYEPYANYEPQLEQKHIAKLFIENLPLAQQQIQRMNTLAQLPTGSIDIVISNSVIEHLQPTIEEYIRPLYAILKPHGKMFHFIDLRDHLFCFPYHFLLFSKQVWNRFLSSGNLPRWRLCDVIAGFDKANFGVHIIFNHGYKRTFQAIKKYIHPTLQKKYASIDLETAIVGIMVQKKELILIFKACYL